MQKTPKNIKTQKTLKNKQKKQKTLKNILENTQLYLLEFGLCMPYLFKMSSHFEFTINKVTAF